MSTYPAFSPAEMQRRRLALECAMADAGVERLLLYGADRSGSAVQWLTGWPVTREAAVIVEPGHADVMFVQYYNHVPLARQLATEADVRPGGPSTIAVTIEELARRGGGSRPLGVIGPLSFKAGTALQREVGEIVDLGAAYTSIRLVKSPEELEWLRTAARFSDAGMIALEERLSAGQTEHELADIVEHAYVPLGGTTHIHYFGVTSMRAPDRCVPAQLTSDRVVRTGDAVTLELSAAHHGYAAQVLRTFAVGEEPTPLYRELHDVADAAYDAILGAVHAGATCEELIAAAGLIEEAGFTTYDDLVHGYGGGYLPPVLGSRSRPAGPVPDLTLQAGMTIVVQPNIVTADGKAGVQTGQLVAVTDTGAESLHAVPRGFRMVD